jgi:hypothetical protein
MHANFEELLNLRDGGACAASLADHVAHCEQCSRELARLDEQKRDLRRLPQFSPPRHLWPSIRDAIERQPRAQPRRPVALAAAATILIVVCLTVTQLGPWNRPSMALPEGPAADNEPMQRLMARSQQLEELLQRLPPRPSVERAATSAAIDDLQTRIQLLDFELDTATRNGNKHEQLARLWTTRVQLLHFLIDVRYAEAVSDVDASTNSRYSGVI